jgi:UDP-N-acetylmuramoyl-tripeptide--D-alanyl-D-alanine ligase
MKKLLKNWLKSYLKWLANKILCKYNPRIIAITGSTGKTTTKEAIFLVLSQASNLRDKLIVKTAGNLNTEFGIPASIVDPNFVGTPVGDKVRLSWRDIFKLIGQANRLINQVEKYPDILILELGADKPGDIAHFMTFIHPEVGILTNIGDVHLEFFDTKANLVEEKRKLITGTLPTGLVILNKDDEFSNLIVRNLATKAVMVSTKVDADYRATNIGLSGSGLRVDIMHGSELLPVTMPVYGKQFAYTALLALAVADYFKVPLSEASRLLIQLKFSASRFEKIDFKNLTLIDDTYNANPTSMMSALESLTSLGMAKRKVAILGDMRELGSAYEKGHRDVGVVAAKTVDFLISIGSGGELIRQSAIGSNLPASKTVGFGDMNDKTQIRSAILPYLRDNDIVLVKGSRAVHLDKIVEVIKENFSE